MSDTAPTPNPLLKTLERLIGTWTVSDPTGKGEMNGQVRFEWMDGGFFMAQHVNLVHDGRPITGIEIIGYDSESNLLRSSYYGNSAEIFKYVWEIEGDTLTIWGGEKGSPARYIGKFSDDGNTNTGGWEWPGGGYESSMTRAKG
ncbi:MAG: DUF1579 family protein [bacterium]|nr:DUF1579 family protein [bacterium]